MKLYDYDFRIIKIKVMFRNDCVEIVYELEASGGIVICVISYVIFFILTFDKPNQRCIFLAKKDVMQMRVPIFNQNTATCFRKIYVHNY